MGFNKFNRYPQPPREYHPAPHRAAAAARCDRMISGSAAVRSARACVAAGKAAFDALPVACRFHWEKIDTQGCSMDEVKRGQAQVEQDFKAAFVSSAREGFLGVPGWLRTPLLEGAELVCVWGFSGSSWRYESFDAWRDWNDAQKSGYEAGRALALGLPQ